MANANAPVTGTVTVTVACKLPHGLVLRIHEPVETEIPVMGGGVKVERHFKPTGREFTVAGNAHPQNEAPIAPIASGFALTHGVPKDLWDKWLEQNRLLPAVVNGLIFAHEHSAKSRDEAKEKIGVKSGLERINPNELPNLSPRHKITTHDKTEAA
jgi:hypothetical protein